jgi:hypothetical protein
MHEKVRAEEALLQRTKLGATPIFVNWMTTLHGLAL